MIRAFIALLAGCVLLSGCAVFRVGLEITGEPKGEIALKAVKRDEPEKLAAGYEFLVVREGRNFGWHLSRADGPVLLKDLAPGRYNVSATGLRIQRHETDVEVTPGRRTVVELLVRDARRSDRMASAAEMVGNFFLYTVFGVAALFIWLWGLTVPDEPDDTCTRCTRDPCVCPRK